jgi:hypothetical protein
MPPTDTAATMETPNLLHHKLVTFHLTNCLKKIAAKTGLNAVEMYKEVIKAEEDVDFVNTIHALAPNAHKVARLELRRTKGRVPQKCQQNAIMEQVKTGNTRRWGWLTTHTYGKHMMCVRHAFNRDKRTGQYYDTQDLPKEVAFQAIVSVSDDDYETIEDGFDYYYIKTKERTFRFKRPFGVENGVEFELELEVLRKTDDGFVCQDLSA